MNDLYCNAVEHLQFSENLTDCVMKQISKPVRHLRFMRYAAAAAVMLVLMSTTAFATSPVFREWTLSNLHLGKSQPDISEAKVMNFTMAQDMEGVTVHYLKLGGLRYHFVHGMLYNNRTGFTAVTDTYELKPVDTIQFRAQLNKNGRNYYDDLDYFETEEGIIDRRKSVLHKDKNGEIFLILTDGSSNQWPAYVNLKKGTVRDALPDWTEDDFEGRVGYAHEYKGGILISTVINDNVDFNGKSVNDSMLYWIADGARQSKVIELSEDTYSWYVENGEFYYTNNEGHLYRMDDFFEYELICDYKTGDELTNGLLTAATADKKLMIVDAYNGNRYLVNDYCVDPGRYLSGASSRFGWELDETMGVNATRYGTDGTIAVVRTEYIPNEQRVAFRELGILDINTGTVKMIEIENAYDGYRNGWLDENRYAVIYTRELENYLCIYEFE
jgi:hypothetical protein